MNLEKHHWEHKRVDKTQTEFENFIIALEKHIPALQRFVHL